MKNSKYIKAGLGYTVSNILLKGVSFLTVPLFTRLLTAGEYGDFSTFLSYENILFIIMSLTLHTTLKNAKYDYPNHYNNYIKNIVCMEFISFLFVIITGFIFHGFFEKILNLQTQLLALLVITSFTSCIIRFYNEKIALDYEYKKYIILSFFVSVFNILLSILLMFTSYKENRLYGRILGNLLPAFMAALFILFSVFKGGKIKLKPEYWKYSCKLSIPLIPHGLSQIVLSSFDRIMIRNIIGSTEAGMYSLAYTVGLILQVLFNSLESVWIPWFYERLKKGNYQDIKEKMALFIAGTSFISGCLILISPELLKILAPRGYWGGSRAVIIVLLGIYFSLLYNFPANIEYFYKKTIYIAVGTMVAALLNIGLNMFYIPRFGYIAAAFTTLATYILYFLIHLFIAHKLMKCPLIDISALIRNVTLTCFTAVVSFIFINNISIRYFTAILFFIYFLRCIRFHEMLKI